MGVPGIVAGPRSRSGSVTGASLPHYRQALRGKDQIMNLHASTAARRILAAAAVTCAAALAPAAALASAGHHAGAARTATPSCATSGLDVWLNTNGSSATGHTGYRLNFTNLSGSTCTLFGYPGVSGVTLGGTQIGSAASRNGTTPHTITLANGATTHALVVITNTDFFPPSSCKAVTAAGLRVYPPNQTKSRVVPFPFSACSKSGTIYLSISPVGSP
jgi:hypothetical protein